MVDTTASHCASRTKSQWRIEKQAKKPRTSLIWFAVGPNHHLSRESLMLSNVISPFNEAVAYETLWGLPKQTLKSLTDLFARCAALPTTVFRRVAKEYLDATELHADVEAYLRIRTGFSVLVNGDFEYPMRLRDAKHPSEIVYYRGDVGLVDTPCVSIVGARDCSDDGKKRASRLARELSSVGYTIVSGLARGIDTAAMQSTLKHGGRLIGVIGTPIDAVYPRENEALQDVVATEHLLMSQVPFYRYAHESFYSHRLHFPARNEVMSALSVATIIVEASEKSGTLTQARECLRQGRKLFILNSCFEDDRLSWPHSYAKRGAIRVRDSSDIIENLPPLNDSAIVEEA